MTASDASDGQPVACVIASGQPLTVRFLCLQVPLIPAVAAGFSAGDVKLSRVCWWPVAVSRTTPGRWSNHAAGIDAALEAAKTKLVHNMVKCFSFRYPGVAVVTRWCHCITCLRATCARGASQYDGRLKPCLKIGT